MINHFLAFEKQISDLEIPTGNPLVIELNKNPDVMLQTSKFTESGDFYIFYIIVILITILAMGIITIIFLIFYYLIYGILLKKLKKNYKELKAIENQ